MAMLTVNVDQLFLSNLGFVVLLKAAQDERSLPIFIGAAEAQAIAIQINDVFVPRPLTHDLMKNMLDFLECRLQKVEICDLRDGTFYAQLIFDHNGEIMTMDARPSDAIALALRCASPIFVEQSIMDEAGKIFDQEESEKDVQAKPQDLNSAQAPPPSAATHAKQPGQKLNPLELLRYRLARAVENERYEEAAKLRDEITRFEGTHREN